MRPALLVLLVLLGAPAVADAAKVPPKVRVTVVATAEARWSVAETAGCVTDTGSGSETTTYRISQTIPLAALGTPMRSGLVASVVSTREGSYTVGLTSGCASGPTCHGSTMTDIFTGVFFIPCTGYTAASTDCGTKTTSIPAGGGLYIGWGDTFTLQLYATRKLWDTCPGPGRTPRSMIAVGGEDFPDFTPAMLSTRKTIVLRGSNDACGFGWCGSPAGPFSKRASWVVKLERVP